MRAHRHPAERIPDAAELQRELDLRTWALNAAPTHFMIIDMTR